MRPRFFLVLDSWCASAIVEYISRKVWDMLEKVREFCIRHKLIPRGANILVGVSGGPDSVALLRVLHSLASELDLHLVVAHLDHGFRGQESADDAAFVRKLSKQLSLPHEVGYVNMPQILSEGGGSTQAKAREVRFEFFRAALNRHGCELLALGHHLDDRVETLFLNMLRGSGLDGITAMPAQDKGLHGLNIIRPLLVVNRSEIEQYLESLGQGYRQDSSNQQDDYTRNLVRHKLLPLLKEINPRVTEAMQRLTQSLTQDADYLTSEASKAWIAIASHGENGIELVVDRLRTTPLAISSRLVRRAWQETSSCELSYQLVMAILGLCGKQAGKRIELGDGVAAVRTPKSLLFLRQPPATTYNLELAVPGRVIIPGIGTITADILDSLPNGSLQPEDGFTAFATDGVKSFVVRTRLPGDRYWPLGAKGTKKLKEAMSVEAIPAPLRAMWPVVCRAHNIAWVPGLRISEQYRVRSSDTRMIRLRLTRGGS